MKRAFYSNCLLMALFVAWRTGGTIMILNWQRRLPHFCVRVKRDQVIHFCAIDPSDSRGCGTLYFKGYIRRDWVGKN